MVADVPGYSDRPGTGIGPTDAINGRLEHLRGSALGSLEPDQLHRQLAPGGQRVRARHYTFEMSQMWDRIIRSSYASFYRRESRTWVQVQRRFKEGIYVGNLLMRAITSTAMSATLVAGLAIGIAPAASGATVAPTNQSVSSDDVNVPVEPTSGIAVEAADGTIVNFGLSGSSDSKRGITDASGDVVYRHKKNAGAVTVQKTEKGGVRQLLTVADRSEGSTFRFPVRLPARLSMTLLDDGSISVTNRNGRVVGSFATPWAVDANGVSVPTKYTLEGNTIVQKLTYSAGTAFPVTADPWWNPFSWNWGSILHKAWSAAKCAASIVAVVAVSARIFKIVKGLGGVSRAVSLMRGAANAQEFINAAGTGAAELLGINAVRTNCFS